MRMKAISISLFFALMTITATAQAPEKTKGNTTVESRITSLVGEWMAAEKQNDLKALDQLIAEDFVGTTFAGTLIAKTDLVTESRRDNLWAGAEVQDVEVHSLGDTAVAIGRIAFKNSNLRFTEVWTKRPTGWQMVVAHLSKA